MTEKFETILAAEGFEITRGFNSGALFADIYAFRKGRNFVFPQRDFFFFHDADARKIDALSAAKLHDAARNFADAMFSMPRALRFTVPNIASVFYSENGIPQGIKELAEKNTRSIIGGEIHQIFALDIKERKFYSQGTHTVRTYGGPMPMKMKFNKIDPQNRAYYIIEKLLKIL